MFLGMSHAVYFLGGVAGFLPVGNGEQRSERDQEQRKHDWHHGCFERMSNCWKRVGRVVKTG